MTLKRLHRMTKVSRGKFFDTATEAEIEAFTEPCDGEAHGNAHIDNCGICLHGPWGRKLRPLMRTIEIPEDLYREIEDAANTPKTGVPAEVWARIELRHSVRHDREWRERMASTKDKGSAER